MKRVLCLMSAAMFVAVTVAAQMPSGQKVGLATSVQRAYAAIKQNLTEEAAKMPDADYSFKPSSMAEVRDYGKLFSHVANAHYAFCSAAKGAPNPNQGKNLENELKTKAEIVKALNDSFAFCDDAYSSLTDQNASDMVKQGMNELTRVALLYNNVVHDNEMYGTAAVYLRAKGLVPPSTERAQGMRGRGGRGNE
jgi:uncharacterized damage-inducible protein DinB